MFLIFQCTAVYMQSNVGKVLQLFLCVLKCEVKNNYRKHLPILWNDGVILKYIFFLEDIIIVYVSVALIPKDLNIRILFSL